MSMEYRIRRTFPSDRVAIIMPVDHGLIFNRIEGLETPSAPFSTWGDKDVTGFMMTPGQVKQTEAFFARHPHLTRVLTIDTYYDYAQLDGGGSHSLITTVEEAVRMGVDAVKMLFPWNVSRAEQAALAQRTASSWMPTSPSAPGPALVRPPPHRPLPYPATRIRPGRRRRHGHGRGPFPRRLGLGPRTATPRPATAWLALTDFVACRWSTTSFLSDTLAARTGAWRPLARTWHTARVRAALGTTGLLPSVVPTGEIVGALRSARLREAGVLAPGALVVAGGHDHPVGGWGVHQLHPGAILDSMGTAEVVVAQTSTPPSPVPTAVDISPGIHNAYGATVLRVAELARNVQWASADPDVAQAINLLIAGDAVPDDHLFSGTFLPGAAGGQPPAFTACVPAAPFSRASAVLGAPAGLGDRAITAVRTITAPDAPVYTAGGWARSRGWIDIKQTVTGRTARVIAEPEVTAVGSALLAAHALGRQPDVTTAARLL